MSVEHDHSAPGHSHATVTAESDRRWLFASLAVILAFMAGEVVVGLWSGSLALLSDAGHMLTDAAALALAIVASRLAQRPARGAYTFGFTRLDALSAQANGITMLLLAIWFGVQAVRRLLHPPAVAGGPMLAVALIGVLVNLLAVALAGRANRASMNVRGALAHLINDLWAFVATAVAGAVILTTGWTRADALATLLVAGLMVHSGLGLTRSAGRVFLEAAPSGVDPSVIGADMARVSGVTEIHDLHVWDLGAGEPALSAHVVVAGDHDCHTVADGVRAVLHDRHHITHATLQADHSHVDGPRTEYEDAGCVGSSDGSVGDHCVVRHGPGYVA